MLKCAQSAWHSVLTTAKHAFWQTASQFGLKIQSSSFWSMQLSMHCWYSLASANVSIIETKRSTVWKHNTFHKGFVIICSKRADVMLLWFTYKSHLLLIYLSSYEMNSEHCCKVIAIQFQLDLIYNKMIRGRQKCYISERRKSTVILLNNCSSTFISLNSCF